MKRTHKGRRSQIIRRMPKNTPMAMATPNGSSVKTFSIAHPMVDLLSPENLSGRISTQPFFQFIIDL